MFHNKTIHWIMILCGVLVLVSLAACAPLIPEFSHQGRLLKPNGDPVADGTYAVIYKFYHVATGGSPVYTTAAQNVVVKDGLFTIDVGASPEDINPEVFAQPTWLEVVVKGETLTPRQKLLGAPYAFSLAPGAVVQGPETLDRTFSGYEKTGATFTVYNNDATTTGGNGMFVVNQAAPAWDPAIVPDPRSQVAALQAIAGGGDAAASPPTGAYGAIVRSKSYRGMHVDTDAPGYYTAVFEGSLGIFVEGNCTGCAMAYIAKNSAAQQIDEGTFVTVEGVEVDPDLNVPIVLVRPVSNTSDPIIGVATGAMTRSVVSDHYGMKTGGFDSKGGSTEPGGYLSVVVSGLVQVKAGLSPTLKVGEWVVPANGQVSAASAGQEGVARLLSAADANGMAWILFTGQ